MLACLTDPPAAPDSGAAAGLLNQRSGLIAALHTVDEVLADADAAVARAEAVQRQARALRAELVGTLRQVQDQIRRERQDRGR